MNIAKQRKAIDTALDNYRAELDTISDERFTETPPGGGWSFAEVYSHILQTTLGSSMALERSAQNNCPATSKGTTFLGKIILFTGRFPPVKLKVPEKVAAKMPATKINKEEAKNLLVKCRKRVDDIAPLIKYSSPNSRYKHPRMGMLNAEQWFRFIGIHLKHHLKQLERVEKKFQG